MEINNPRDKFFKETFSNKENVKDLLINALPGNISQKIDFNSIAFSNRNYIDENLKESYSDLPVKTNIDKSECFIYILVEHKSYPDKYTVFQLLKYMISIWNDEIKEKNREYLTPVLPIIFYHGETGWKFSDRFAGYFPENNMLREYTPGFRSIIYDLSDIDDKKIDGNAAYIVSVITMKHIFSDFRRRLPGILEYINKNLVLMKFLVDFSGYFCII